MAKAPRAPPRDVPIVAVIKANGELRAVAEGIERTGAVDFAAALAAIDRSRRAQRRLEWEKATAKRGGAWARVLRASERALGDAYAGRKRVACEETGHKWTLYGHDPHGQRVAAIEVTAPAPHREADFRLRVVATVLRPDLLAPGGAESLQSMTRGEEVDALLAWIMQQGTEGCDG